MGSIGFGGSLRRRTVQGRTRPEDLVGYLGVKSMALGCVGVVVAGDGCGVCDEEGR